MSIRYITTGNEKIARSLLGEGRHQLTILKNAMTFQKLQQLQRIVRFDDGTVIKCSSCFGQDVVNVYVPIIPVPVEKERKIVLILYCWGSDYFTEGKITEIFGDYGDVGDYEGKKYPNYCNSNDQAIKNYVGIRYKVKICQGILLNLPARTEYICLPSDFAEYEVGDKVIVFMRGAWDGSELIEPEKREPGKSCKNNDIVTCIASKGTKRTGITGEEADGSYLIMPLEVEGVNPES